MKIVRITAHAGCTFNHPHEQYSNFRPGITLEAEVEKRDDLEVVVKELQAATQELLDAEKARILADCGRVHKVRLLKAEMAAFIEQANSAQADIDNFTAIKKFPAVDEWGRNIASEFDRDRRVEGRRKDLERADGKILDAHRQLRELGVSQDEIDRDVAGAVEARGLEDPDELEHEREDTDAEND
jgi:hypothetical protein